MSEFFTQKYQKSGVHLSSSEKYVLTYIENNLAKIPAISIVKLSEEANVSTATIVRAMKKIGYDGFTSFKHHLKDAEEVTRTIQLLDSGTIEDALQKIKAASKISIFARGFSELIAKEMAIKFQLMGKHCDLHDDPNIIRSISKKIKSTEIVIFISLSGETPELIEAAKNCQKQNVSTITFTANQDGPLIKLSELIFVGYKSAISYFPDYEVRSRLPLQVMTRILLDSYASRFVSD